MCAYINSIYTENYNIDSNTAEKQVNQEKNH